MSRIGKAPVALSSKVKVAYKDGVVNVKGPVGEMSYTVPQGVDLKVDETSINVVADFTTSEGRMMSGTTRANLNNMVFGVTEGFTKSLELNGVGYRAQLSGQKLTLTLGFSHPVEYELPKAVKAKVDANTKLTLTSCDKQLVGQVAAEIRKYRMPEPYKGKGILFTGEIVRRKAGKSAKK